MSVAEPVIAIEVKIIAAQQLSGFGTRIAEISDMDVPAAKIPITCETTCFPEQYRIPTAILRRQSWQASHQ